MSFLLILFLFAFTWAVLSAGLACLLAMIANAIGTTFEDEPESATGP